MPLVSTWASVSARGFGFGQALPAVTWNPSDKSAVWTLSNGNRTATHNTTSTQGGIRATTARNSGLRYIEQKRTSVNTVLMGFANSTYSLSAGLGSDANSVSVSDTGSVVQNGVVIGTVAANSTNDVVGFSPNLSTNLLWIRVNGGNWNNNALADPSTGVGGISILSGSLYPAMSCDNLDSVCVINDGTSGFAYAAPTGALLWGYA